MHIALLFIAESSSIMPTPASSLAVSSTVITCVGVLDCEGRFVSKFHLRDLEWVGLVDSCELVKLTVNLVTAGVYHNG